MYKSWNILGVAFYCTATLLIFAASVFISQRWAACVALVYVGVNNLISLRAQKDHYENNLVKHPDVHKFSPNLGKIVADLYKVSGLDEKSSPIYDHRVDDKKKDRSGLYGQIGNLIARTHNAAATDLGKPVIMISEPLLKLLDDPEEKAVLAHEFAHVVGHDPGTKLFQGLMARTATITNICTMLWALWMAGWQGILGALVMLYLCFSLVKRLHPDGRFLYVKKHAKLSAHDLVKRDGVMRIYGALCLIATMPVLTYFYHPYAQLFAATWCLSTSASLLTNAFSRSREYQADRGAIALGADPLALITGLRKIFILQERGKTKAFEGKMPKINPLIKRWKQLYSSHPPFHDRMMRLVAIARKQGAPSDLIQQSAAGRIELSADHDIPDDLIRQMARNLAHDL